MQHGAGTTIEAGLIIFQNRNQLFSCCGLQIEISQVRDLNRFANTFPSWVKRCLCFYWTQRFLLLMCFKNMSCLSWCPHSVLIQMLLLHHLLPAPHSTCTKKTFDSISMFLWYPITFSTRCLLVTQSFGPRPSLRCSKTFLIPRGRPECIT